MTRLIKKVSAKAGLTPGTMVFVGDRKTETVKITIMDYDDASLRELEVGSVEECFPFKDSPTVTWIDMTGVHDVDAVERLGGYFGVHPLLLEDIVNTGERPKMEETDAYVFVALKMLYNGSQPNGYISEQVSLVFGKNFVISFQEKESDVFDSVRERIRRTVPRKRLMGADYVAYSLIDAIVDNYFIILEHLGERIETLEDVLLIDPAPGSLGAIHEMKRELILMRKRIWPLREVVGALERSESHLFHDYTRVYIRDLYEHVIQVIDTVETFRDMVAGLIDIYLSSVSNKMNQVMKVLTVIATIFIPLGFLAGVYGMNFDTSASPFNMPELRHPFGYIGFWTLAIMVGGGFLWFFKRKHWV